jgi:hypothetical protein
MAVDCPLTDASDTDDRGLSRGVDAERWVFLAGVCGLRCCSMFVGVVMPLVYRIRAYFDIDVDASASCAGCWTNIDMKKWLQVLLRGL